ncbi:hypothetical protein [Selenomonas sp. oral taxon 892]|jgi:hypothetical protein|uniref:hypothetical protein n=1 Tax=Selenomonas sp. oral taxon 892 TaxID=1321785 RepID=UPI0003ACF304|nr:hypothetical protein [Selenomonas sp. oral taxon 892]ERJ92886.1 hypothetical protein HMPREF1992_01267 [Selenomonas sp. oral taxon 892 str. F0426]
MKKYALFAAVIGLSISSAVTAAPINHLGTHDTAVGVGTKEAYIEHKATDEITIGVGRNDRDEYGNPKDVYMQYNLLGQNVRLMGGYRWGMDQANENNVYGGLALSTPTIPVIGFNAYASYIAGKDFNESQVGLNKSLIANLDLNVNYHNFKPDHGKRESGVGIGLTMSF